MANNFRRIVTLVTNDIAAMGEKDKRDPVDAAQTSWSKKRQAAPPFTEANQQAICDAFRGVSHRRSDHQLLKPDMKQFVRVHQALLATVIGKHGLLSTFGVARPIARVLRELEKVVDTLAFGIIDLVPFCAQSATQDKDALDRSLRDAVDTYN